MSARLLVQTLRDPSRAANLPDEHWNGLIAAARAERLMGTLAMRLSNLSLPVAVQAAMDDAIFDATRERQQALWEADRMREALAPLGVPVILLKGTAYVAANLSAGGGRSIGDLDILVPRDALAGVEAALLNAGWEWVKHDPYDDAYYRAWMHELPPLIHRERDRMIDVHHTILPLTARPKPDAVAMIADSVTVEGDWRILCPQDRICHAAAHLFADGDLGGGLRNLWDIHCLLAEHGTADVDARAALHGLDKAVARAIRLSAALYGAGARLGVIDRLFVRRLLSRDGWGRDGHKLTGFVFYVRSHLLRVPPLMLVRHLLTKWRIGYRPVS